MFFRFVLLALLGPACAITEGSGVGAIWSFPNETWIENLAVRQNGEILCTSINRAAIYLVNPFERTAMTMHQFSAEDGVLGIAETENDVFIVVTSTINLATSAATPGSSKAWKVDMTAYELDASTPVTLIANLTSVGLPDGVVALGEPEMVLIADAAKGLVWKLDAITGLYAVAIQSDLFNATNPLIPLGVDGIHIANDQLYFTNLGSGLFGRIPTNANGTAAGLAESIASLTYPDDFALQSDGTAYVVGANTLYRVHPNGTSSMVAGGVNDTTLKGATSAQFGRTHVDQNVLYIGTNGGVLAPVGGRIVGGQILAVNVDTL